jgi:hypothetical protein
LYNNNDEALRCKQIKKCFSKLVRFIAMKNINNIGQSQLYRPHLGLFRKDSRPSGAQFSYLGGSSKADVNLATRMMASSAVKSYN